MSSTLRCAVIGAGGIAKSHIEGFRKHDKAEVVAVAEISEERRKEAQETFDIPKAVEDYKELLADKDIDAVSIALPNFLHSKVSVEALKAGKHVLLEKPMATSAAEAQTILDALKGTDLVFMVGQNFRFTKDAQIARDYISRGELGEVYHGRAFWLRSWGIPRIGSWFTQKEFSGGGCGYDIGVHLLDCALHLMGNFDAESVSGITYSKFGPRGLGSGGWGKGDINPDKPFDVEDFAGALIKLKGGKSLFLEVSWALHADQKSGTGIHLYGTEGGAELYPVRFVKAKGNVTETIDAKFNRLPVSEDRMVHFVDCVVNGAEPLVKPEESFKVQKILDALYESGRTGREVRISG